MSQVLEQNAAAPAVAEMSFFDTVIEQGVRPRDEEQRESAKAVIAHLADEVLKERIKITKDTLDWERKISARIAEIDRVLSLQLNEVMHASEFQKLEASWRGLHYLVQQTETGEQLKLRVLNATKKDLLKDAEKAVEFDQSALFKKIYEEEYGTFGGDPFGALIGDYEFGEDPKDMFLLEKLSNVAAAAHAPFFAAASPYLFNMESFSELGVPRDLEKIFDNKSEAKYIKWRSFRESDDARYVGLAMPHILMRLPYGSETEPVEAFNYEEDVDGKEHGKYLWGNAAYALGARLTDAFAKYNWCVAMRGVEGGGLVQGLPTHSFKTDEGEVALKCPTEIAITDRRENELAKLGFISLLHCKGTDYAAFFSAQSAHKPPKYDTDAANANARLSAQMQYIMASSRFAHYLKAMMRDKIGAFMTRQDCQDFLNRWIAQYTMGNPEAGQELKAKRPLKEARIDVAEVAGKPGVYKAVAFLNPHYQLDELTVSLRLVAELPPPVKG